MKFDIGKFCKNLSTNFYLCGTILTTPVDDELRAFLRAFWTCHDIFVRAKNASAELVWNNHTQFYDKYRFCARPSFL